MDGPWWRGMHPQIPHWWDRPWLAHPPRENLMLGLAPANLHALCCTTVRAPWEHAHHTLCSQSNYAELRPFNGWFSLWNGFPLTLRLFPLCYQLFLSTELGSE